MAHEITESVADILRDGRIEGCVFFLPDGQLDRATYVAVNKVLGAPPWRLMRRS